MDYNLLLINNPKIIEKNKKYILFGNYNILENQNLDSYNIKIFQEGFINNKNLTERFDYCENLFLKLLKTLTVNLNFIHGTNYTERSWNIMLGKFLKQFIYIVFKSYSNLKIILSENNIRDIYLIDPKKYQLYVDNTQALTSSNQDDKWLAALNSKILKKMNLKVNFFYINLDQDKFNQQNHHKFTIQSCLKKFLSSILKYFYKNNNKIIYLSGMPFFFEKMLEIKLKQLPSLYNLPKIKYNNYDGFLRSKIDLKSIKPDNEFEKILLSLIPEALPKHIIENFKDLYMLTKKSFLNNNPKIIFTSMGHAYDEVFKYYVANKSENGSKYYVMQHGNKSFVDINSNYISEFENSDFYISWGKGKNNQKIINGFNLKSIKKLRIKKKINLSIITNSIFSDPVPYEIDNLNKINLVKTSELINALNDDIKKQAIVKFHQDTIDYKNFYFYKDLFSKNFIKIYDKNVKMSSVIKRSKLFLFNYDSSGVYENLARNIPTVFIIPKNLNRILNEHKIKYDYLKKAKIFFDTETDLINHINNVWRDVDTWWFNKDTQKNIKKFNMDMNIPYKNFNKILTLLK